MNRIIPCLLVDNKALYKTINFKNPRYLGDPFNTIRLFNGKEVDEIVVLDFGASRDKKHPDFDFIKKLASECFMPICYGGGLSTIEDVEKVFRLGIDKVSFNTALHNNISLVKEAIKRYGSQSIVASIDYKIVESSYYVHIDNGRTNTRLELIDFAKQVESIGVGELLVTSIDNEGTYKGYDEYLYKVCQTVKIPVSVNGGANSFKEMKNALERGASAAVAGSLFSFFGRKKAVIPNYLSYEEICTQVTEHKSVIKSEGS